MRKLEGVLEMDGGDGCANSVNVLNVTESYAENGDHGMFMSGIFYHSKKAKILVLGHIC